MHLSRLKWCLIDSARRAESEYVSLNKKYVNAVWVSSAKPFVVSDILNSLTDTNSSLLWTLILFPPLRTYSRFLLIYVYNLLHLISEITFTVFCLYRTIIISKMFSYQYVILLTRHYSAEVIRVIKLDYFLKLVGRNPSPPFRLRFCQYSLFYAHFFCFNNRKRYLKKIHFFLSSPRFWSKCYNGYLFGKRRTFWALSFQIKQQGVVVFSSNVLRNLT